MRNRKRQKTEDMYLSFRNTESIALKQIDLKTNQPFMKNMVTFLITKGKILTIDMLFCEMTIITYLYSKQFGIVSTVSLTAAVAIVLE